MLKNGYIFFVNPIYKLSSLWYNVVTKIIYANIFKKYVRSDEQNARKQEENMSKKTKNVIKFFVACGIIVSAVAAVFAVLYRMRAKLNAAEECENEADEGCCDGICENCDICDDAVALDAEAADEVAEDASEVNE